MLQSVSLCLLWICSIITTYGDATNTLSWSISTTTLPRPDRQMAVAYSSTTGLLWLIGGSNNRNQLISFDPSSLNTTSPFINDTTDALSEDFSFSGQAYTQIGDVLYMIDRSGESISIFDLLSQEFISFYNNITIPQSVRYHACLAQIDQYLIITGGIDENDNILSKVQIYDLIEESWILTANDMNTRRGKHACIVNENSKYLYVFGGDNIFGGAAGMLDTISKLYVGDMDHIQNYHWMDLHDTLSKAVQGVRAIVYNNDIYIIGGQYYESETHINNIGGQYQYSAYVDRLTSDDKVVADLNLLQPTSYASCIVANDKLFVIGGYVNDYYLDTIQYAIPESYSSIHPSNEAGLGLEDMIGIICGCSALVCCLVILALIYFKKKQEKRGEKAEAEEDDHSATESHISEQGEEDNKSSPSIAPGKAKIGGNNSKYASNAPPYLNELRQHIKMNYVQVIEPSAPDPDLEEDDAKLCSPNVVDTRRETDEDKLFQETDPFGPGGIGGEEGNEGQGEQLEIVDDLDMDGRELLMHWNLGKYAKAMIDEQGWIDPLEWKYFTKETLKNDIGFKDSQIRKFMHKYRDWLRRKNQ